MLQTTPYHPFGGHIGNDFFVSLSTLEISGNAIPKCISHQGFSDKHKVMSNFNWQDLVFPVVYLEFDYCNGNCSWVGLEFSTSFFQGGRVGRCYILIASDCLFAAPLNVIRMQKPHDGGNFGAFPGTFVTGTTLIQSTLSCFTSHVGFMGWISDRSVDSCHPSDVSCRIRYQLSNGIFCVCRFPDGVQLWFMPAAPVSYLYYHELWRRQCKPYFVALHGIFSSRYRAIVSMHALWFVVLGFFRPMRSRNPQFATRQKLQDEARRGPGDREMELMHSQSTSCIYDDCILTISFCVHFCCQFRHTLLPCDTSSRMAANGWILHRGIAPTKPATNWCSAPQRKPVFLAHIAPPPKRTPGITRVDGQRSHKESARYIHR